MLHNVRSTWQSGGTARSNLLVPGVSLLVSLGLIVAAVVTLIGGGDGALSEAGGFAFISVFFIAGTYFAAARTMQDMRERLAAQPTDEHEPWKRRPDWAAGRVSTTKKAAIRHSVIAALFWNAVSWPFAIIITATPREEVGLSVVLLIWIFPLAGLWLVWKVCQLWVLRRRFGESVFEMDPVPGMIGGRLQGRVLTAIPANGMHHPEMTARLTCTRRFVTTERSRGRTVTRTHTDQIWWDEKRLSTRPRSDGSGGIAIPLSFDIPPDVRPTRLDDPEDRISWTLSVSSNEPGIRYAASFDVPVFHVEDALLATGADPAQTFDSLAALSRDHGYQETELEPDLSEPLTPAIEIIREDPYLEVFFRMARGLAIGQGVTAGLLLTGSVVTAWFGAGGIAFFLFLGAGALGYQALKYSRKATRIVVRDGELLVYDGPAPGSAPVRVIDGANIERVAVESGSSDLARSMSSYNLMVHHPGGTTTTVGKYLPDRREAEWIADKIRDHLRSPGEWLSRQEPAESRDHS